jgi:hypothetical protein
LLICETPECDRYEGHADALRRTSVDRHQATFSVRRVIAGAEQFYLSVLTKTSPEIR